MTVKINLTKCKVVFLVRRLNPINYNFKALGITIDNYLSKKHQPSDIVSNKKVLFFGILGYACIFL